MVDYLESSRERRPPLRAELQLALNLVPAHTFYADPSGALTFVNERLADYLGLPKDHPLRSGIATDAAWDSHLHFVHPDEYEEARKVWSTCLRTGRAGDFSFRVRNAEGKYRWFLTRAEPVRASDGTLLYWIGVNLDIEDRKEAEFYLAEGQRLARMGSWAFNAAGFDYWSPELFRIYGLDPSGRPPTVEEYMELVHPDDREFVAETIQKMFAEHSGFDFTKRIVRPDGEIRRVRCVGSPATHAGAVQEFIGTGIDVTEHELLTQEIGRREAYLAEAQRLSHTGSFGWKPDTGEIIWSAETYRIFEYDPAVMPTIDFLVQRVHPEDRADFQSVIERASGGNPDFEHAYRLLLPDGRVKHVHALAHATLDAFGNREFVGAVTDITEQRRAEESLRESESYLAEAQKLSHTGSWAWNPNLNKDIRYWSEECYRVLGFDPAGPLPQFEEFFQKIHPDDQAASRERFEKAIGDKADFELDYRIVHPDKGVRDIHVVGHAVLDRSGDLIEFIGTVIDITERKRAEEELRASERKYRNLVDTTPAFVHTALPNGEVDFYNRGWLEYVGLTLKDLQQWGWTCMIHPEDLETIVPKWRAAVEAGEPFVGESRVRRADGEYRWFLHREEPLRNEAGEIVKWYGSSIEIEERKVAEEKIREQETELRQILDLTPQHISVLEPNGRPIYTNRAAFEYFGLTIDQWRAMVDRGTAPESACEPGRREAPHSWLESRLDLIHPEDREHFVSQRKRGFLEGRPYEFEARLRRHDGEFRHFLFRVIPFKDEGGHITRWYGTATDIEDRKRAEEEIRKENVRLEERTRIAQELHDTLLQTFLSASMQLGVALDGVAPDSLVKPRLDRILQLMNQGIAEGRNTIQGLRSPDSHTLDLVVALSRVQQELAVQPNIDFRVVVAGRQQPLRPPIRHEIYRIGREALVNAFRHSQAKRVELELEYADIDLRMWVRDDGRGIDPQVLHAGREGHWGLAGMHERAERIGARLKIRSRATGGTEVELFVPNQIAFEHQPSQRPLGWLGAQV